MHIMIISEEEKKGQKAYLKKQLPKTFQIWKKEMYIQIQRAWWTLTNIKSKKSKQSHYNQIVKSQKQRENFQRSKRKITYKRAPNGLSVDFSEETLQARRE